MRSSPTKNFDVCTHVNLVPDKQLQIRPCQKCRTFSSLECCLSVASCFLLLLQPSIMVKFLQTVFSAVPLLQSPFSQDSLFPHAAPKVKPYCLAGSSCFPSSSNINAFNASIHGRLLTPSQPALPCYPGPGFDAVKCEEVRSSFANPGMPIVYAF